MTAPELPPTPKKGIGCLGCLGLITVAVLIGFGAIMLFGALNKDDSRDGKYEAIAQCEARVEKQLKAPSTADFATTATGSGDTWTVIGTVDSENSFGGTVRSEFECAVTLEGDMATTTINYIR